MPVARRATGGSAWESNPASPLSRRATGFEDREGHRAPFASPLSLPLYRIGCSRGRRLQDQPRVADSPRDALAVQELEQRNRILAADVVAVLERGDVNP